MLVMGMCIFRKDTRRGVANEKNHEHTIPRPSDMMGSFLQPMLQTMMQLLQPGSVSAQQFLQPGSASASPSSSNGLQIQMLAPASGPKPLPPSRSLETIPEEPQAEQAKACGPEEMKTRRRYVARKKMKTRRSRPRHPRKRARTRWQWKCAPRPSLPV